jgi:hypothetical protein
LDEALRAESRPHGDRVSPLAFLDLIRHASSYR